MNDVELDYKGMHAQLSKVKRNSKEIRNLVIIGSTTLEFAIAQLVKIGAEKLKLSPFRKAMKKSFTPVSEKLRILGNAKIIDKKLQGNLTILFQIRNKIAHELFITLKDVDPVFEPLRNISTTNQFLTSLRNDSIKFQLVTSKCFAELVNISESLDPDSVLKLELVGDITPVEE